MRELGESSDQDHAAIGTLASELGIDHLVCVAAPEYAQAIPAQSATTVHTCASKEQAATMVASMNKGDVVLVKASRSEKLEELAEMIMQAWSERIQGMAETE
jgi:UDP-N-acetylmuramoyl-tripeptide--D-alanyl-D-alanine ligase